MEGEEQGMVKLVCDKKKKIIGAHILGSNAGELLPEYVLAIQTGIPITKISQTIHVYPTVAQIIKRTCDQYYRQKLFSGWFPKLAKKLIAFS
jgi:pyruvate/2-oxoglutarate dehydrogenase complex dihydrolipoamide dehydrogenase (E3) component